MRLDFYIKQLIPTVGATIVGVVNDPDGEFFGLSLRLKGGAKKVLWFQSDDEGNGPGSFSLEDSTEAT